MEYSDDLAALIEQIKQASADLEQGDARTNKRIDEITKSVDELFKKVGPSSAPTTMRSLSGRMPLVSVRPGAV